MMSNHFPMTYGHPQGWLVLVALMALGAWVRHFFNLRHQGRVVWAIPASAALGVLVLALAIAPRNVASTRSVTFAQAQAVIGQRCQPCHSVQPTQPGFPQAPNGVMFDTPDQIVGRAQQIYQQAVVTKNMPLANLTNITPDERDLLGAWVREGAGARYDGIELQMMVVAAVITDDREGTATAFAPGFNAAQPTSEL